MLGSQCNLRCSGDALQPSSKAARELDSLDTQVRQERLLVEQLEKIDQQFQTSRQGASPVWRLALQRKLSSESLTIMTCLENEDCQEAVYLQL